MGTIEQRRGNYPDAIELFNESIETWRAVNNDLGAAMALHHLGMIERSEERLSFELERFYNLSLETNGNSERDLRWQLRFPTSPRLS